MMVRFKRGHCAPHTSSRANQSCLCQAGGVSSDAASDRWGSRHSKATAQRCSCYFLSLSWHSAWSSSSNRLLMTGRCTHKVFSTNTVWIRLSEIHCVTKCVPLFWIHAGNLAATYISFILSPGSASSSWLTLWLTSLWNTAVPHALDLASVRELW